MTTVDRPNVHAIALEGSFDDCQTIVKTLFGDLAFRDELGLSGVNSINWARIVAQIVYYFTAAVALGAPDRQRLLRRADRQFRRRARRLFRQAAWACRSSRLIVATNENDILARALATGRYEPRGVKATQSPSMDIQVSSNFERLLFDAFGRDAGAVRGADGERCSKRATSTIRAAGAGGDPRAISTPSAPTRRPCAAEMARVYREVRVMRRSAHRGRRPCGARGARARSRDAGGRARHRPSRQIPRRGRARRPASVPPLPPHLADLFERRERFAVLPNDARGGGGLHPRARARVAA